MFDSEWEGELREAVETLTSGGWKLYIEPYYIQGEETLTLKKNDKYLHLVLGELEDLKTLIKELNIPTV